MIRIGIADWTLTAGRINTPVPDAVAALGQPAIVCTVHAPALANGRPSRSFALVTVEAADAYPWATLAANTPTVRWLPLKAAAELVTSGDLNAVTTPLTALGIQVAAGTAWHDAVETIARAIHPQSSGGLSRYLRGIKAPPSSAGTFTDAFTEASDTNLESHTPTGGGSWTRVGGAAGAGVARSQDDLKVNSTTVTEYDCTDQGSADQYTQAVLVSESTGRRNSYVCVRLVSSSAFIGWHNWSTTSHRLCKMVGGVLTDSLIDINATAGNTYRIEASGSTVRFYENGVQQGADQTITDGQTETTQGVVIGDSSTGGLDPSAPAPAGTKQCRGGKQSNTEVLE